MVADLRRRRHLLATSTRRSRRPSPRRSRLRAADAVHPGRAARRHQRVGVGAGHHRHRLRGDRAGGAARPAHRGARAVRGRSARARRARARCRTRRTRSAPSGSPGWPASSARRSCRSWRASRCGTSGTSRTPPPSGSFLPDAAITTDYLLHLTARPGGEPGRRRRPDAREPRVHRRADLHLRRPAGAGRGGAWAARQAYALVQSAAMRHLGDRDAVPRDAARPGGRGRRRAWTRPELDEICRPERYVRTSARCSTGWPRCRDRGALRAPRPRQGPRRLRRGRRPAAAGGQRPDLRLRPRAAHARSRTRAGC